MTVYKYFSRDQYAAYSNQIKEQILLSIRTRINTIRQAKGLPEYATNNEAFIYENVDIIHSCVNQVYFNKCINYHIDLRDSITQPTTDSVKDNFRGGYYEKYLKYKMKYLNLKKTII